MRIDRPDEDDKLIEPESPAVQRDAPSSGCACPAEVENSGDPDLEAIQTAHKVEYRATVEVEYRAAWEEAVPVFQRTWAEHQERYPHPERSRPTAHDDGSWRGEGPLKLSPEQNAQVDRHCDRIREIGDKVIIPAMLRIEAEQPDRGLVGYDKRFKDPDRVKEKVAEVLLPPSKLTVAQALSTVPDAVRFTLCHEKSGYADGVRTDVERLKVQGFELMRLKNTWTKDQYKGINTQWREPESDVRFEVQFHTQVSFEAKELSHKAYERLRGSFAQDDEREELEAFQSAVCAMIQIPPGVIDIENYPPEKRDG